MIDFADTNSGLTILSYYLPLVFSILSLICCVLFLFTYLKYEKLRVNSGKIHFILGFCITFLTAHFLASLFYSVDEAPDNSDEDYTSPTWCTALGVITNLVLYNFLLLHLFVSHNVLCCIFYKYSTFNRRYRIYLILSLGISVAITIILGCFNEIGYGPLGFCWLRNEKVSQIIHIITVCVIFPLVLGVQIYVYSKEHFINPHSLYYYNEDNFTVNNRKLFIRINLGYIFVFTLTWLPSSVIYIIDFVFKFNDWDNEAYWFEIVRGIALLFLCASAFCMFLVRVHEPVIKKAFKKIIGKFQKDQPEQPQEQSQNLDSIEAKDEVSLTENLIEQKEAKFKISRNIQPQQYEIVLTMKKNSSQNELFSMFKKKKPAFLKSNSKNLSEKEKAESKLLLIKCFLGSVFLIRNDINNQEVTINSKTPWEDHYYNDITSLKSKLGDIIRLIMKNDNEGIDKMLELFDENQLEDVTCVNIASLVFANVKSLYHIDNILLFDSFYPIENMKILESIEYDPMTLHEEVSINNFITFNNKYYLKIFSESRMQFLKESFLKSLHDHITKSKGNSFLAPLICLYNISFMTVESINLAIYENLIGQTPLTDLYALLILEGLNIVHKKFKNGALISTDIFPCNGYQMENVLKLKYKDKSLLMKVMKTDLKFLLARDVTNYQIHLIFSKNPQKVNFSIDNQKSVNNPFEENMTTSQASIKKNGFKFECFLEDYECRVAIHNYLNTQSSISKGNIINIDNNPGTRYGTEVNNNLVMSGENKANMLKKLPSGLNENFSVINPEIYAKNIMEALQDLL